MVDPKPHLECFTNSYHIYKKYFCTLISCEWVYGTTLSLIPNLNEGWFLGNLGGRDRPIWCDYIILDEPQTPLGMLHKFISYIKKYFCTLISCEWVYGTTLSLIPRWVKGQFSAMFGVGTDLSDVVTSWWTPNPTWSASRIHIIYIKSVSAPW
jgi:hypothetical protein